MLYVECTIHGDIEDFSPVSTAVVFSHFEREVTSHTHWRCTDGQGGTIDVDVVVEKEET